MSTRYLFLGLTLWLFFSKATAQYHSGPILVNSGDILRQGETLQENDKYKEALALYNLVPPSDTNYSQILHDKVMCAYLDSNLETALRYADTGLISFPEDAPNWYELKGDALNNLGKKDSSLTFYDKALALDSKKYESWFNKGVALYGLNRYGEAEKCFEQCVLIYPYHASSHYYLGVCAMELGNPVSSMLSFMASLMMNPEGRHNGQIVRMMTRISNVDDEVAKLVESHPDEEGNHFEVEQEVLMSKVALDKQYKLQSDVEDGIVRQMQALLEKTDYRKEDGGFWMQYYVPYFKASFASGQFNLMVHELFSGLKIKSIDEWNKHHESEVKAFMENAVHYFNKIQETEMLPLEARDTVTIKHLIEDGTYEGRGNWVINGKKRLLTGYWNFYFSNGSLRSRGLFDEKGKKQGVWEYYYNNKLMRERAEMKDDLVDGRDQEWFDNGVLKEDAHLVNGKYEGVVRDRCYNGLPRSVTQYSGGERAGTDTGYTSNGTLKSVTHYQHDLADGDAVTYFTNGQPELIMHYEHGKEEGVEKKYNRRGVLIREITYKNGKGDGPVKYYYDNGALREDYMEVNDEAEGISKEYYKNGQLKAVQTYVKGKVDGQETDYTESGRVYEEDVYEKGKLKEVKCTGPDGKVLSSTSIRSAGTLTFYDTLGNKETDGYYSFKGDKEGKFTNYFPNGNIRETSQYKGGDKEGPLVHYFASGLVSDSTNYSQDQEQGYFVRYFANGLKKEEGFYVGGSLEGPYYRYDEMGNLMTSGYYKDGDKEGTWDWYSPGHKKTLENVYSQGWEFQSTDFDTAGKPLTVMTILPTEIRYKLKYANGKTAAEGWFRNYQLDGHNMHYYFDGSPMVDQFYRQELSDSTYKSYYFGGSLCKQGTYNHDFRNGRWVTYFDHGNLYSVSHYKEDDKEGIDSIFNEDGTLDETSTYQGDQMEGPYVIYGDNNKIAYILYYHDDDLVGYAYLGKDERPITMIPLPLGYGKVEAYYANGQKSASFNMVAGEVDGLRTFWYSNGTVMISGDKTAGRVETLEKTFYPNGKVKYEQSYYCNKLQGIYKSYYPSGVLKEELYYYNGELEGPCKYYDESGHLVRTRLYYYDVLQAVIK